MRLKSVLSVFFATTCSVFAAPNIKLPNYQFKYTVNDPNTNDHKIQVERKVGDQLTTAYVVKTIHPVPQNGAQGGNSYIGVSRWSGDKTGPIPIFPKDDAFYGRPIAIHPFIEKFGIGQKMGLYPDLNKFPNKAVKPPSIYKIPNTNYGWPKDKPIIEKIPSHDYGWYKDKDIKGGITYHHDQSKGKPKPIFIIIEKRPSIPSKGVYHTVNKVYKDKNYVGSKIPSKYDASYDWPKSDYHTVDKVGKSKDYIDIKTPSSYDVSYNWPKRYGHSKFEHNYDTDIDGKGKTLYDAHYPLRDYGTHAEHRKDYDDHPASNKNSLYHRYTYDMRYGTGDHSKTPHDKDEDKKYDFPSEKEEEDDEYDDDHPVYDVPKSSKKISSESYESSDEGDDKEGWESKSKESDDDDDEEEDEDYFGKSVYEKPSYFKNDEKIEHKKWFADKRKGDDKSYEYNHEKDCEETSH